ncbi:hypothetical protein [Streptomyces qinglanensis]|uniref:Uncharacterized protein n=1 Tax=Streptomyces qinglanensis TaxID=943816 RepID=A0A1H9U4L3_9ACTN|nr:hypothetical protein [Streptomyces qinglanensis]SES04178.1 hypothetical protein SAMN05421870_107309 [Streptomyces qinglanensis]
MTETITYKEVGTFLGLAAARDQRTVGDADVLAWHADLNAARINYAAAEAALTRFYLEMASRKPEDRFRATAVDIIDLARKARRDRLTNFQYEPPPGDEDPNYLARLRGQIAATADGHRPADPVPPALEGGSPQALARVLEGVGREIPAEPGEEEAREAAKPRPFSVQCPACQARVGQHCRWPGGKRRPTHGARKRTALGEPVADPAAAREEERRRTAAAEALARLTPEQRAQMDAINHQEPA